MLRGVALPERYEPIRRIARGGMASVWCAQDRVLERHVAIKLLAEPYAQDELAGRRFKREARAAARLSGHPNVVTIYDVGEASTDAPGTGRPFIVMEYLPSGTAADALRHGGVDRQTAVRWLHQAAAALDYAHQQGVIHRDVKLANFLLDRERVLHVADFGIAQLGSEDTLTVSGEVLGTAGYLAPERALGRPATAASDRYALAVAAYELLVGERPFAAENFAAQARQHLEDPPPRGSARNPALPAALDAVLARGMAKRPEDRFASAAELVDAIDHVLIESPSRRPAAASPSWIPAPPLTGGRHFRGGRAAALAALAAALIGVVIAASLSGGGQPRPAARAAVAHRSSASPPAPSPQPTTNTPANQPTTPGPATTPTAPPPSDATTLEAQGHALMMGGNYRNAIPLLQQAVAAADPNSLTYAYALYDLGRSLRLDGNPRAAVPILYRRLQIPNQTNVVRAELALALEALGQQVSGGSASAASGPPSNSPPPGHGHHGPQAGPARALDVPAGPSD